MSCGDVPSRRGWPVPSEDVEAIEAALATAAVSPLRVKTDAAEVESRPIDDLIAARNALSGNSAGSRPRRGLRMTKLIPPGAV